MNYEGELIRLIDSEILNHSEQLKQDTKCVGQDSVEAKAEALNVAMLKEIRRRLALRKVSREFIEDLCVVARAYTNVLDSIADVTELLAGCGIEVEVEKP